MTDKISLTTGVPTIPGAAGGIYTSADTAARSYSTVQPDPARGPARPSRTALPVLGAIGFLLLAAAIAYVWQQQQTILAQSVGVDAAMVSGLQGQVRTLQQRLAQVEQRPAAPPVDLTAINARIQALETKPAPPPPPMPDIAGAIAPLQKRLDTLASAEQNASAGMAGRVEGLEKRLAQSDQQAQALAGVAARARQVQAATVLLDAGKPLGEIPGAPSALARFAKVAPPTDASLRLSFPEAAHVAATASQPVTAGESVTQRMWQRAQGLVTVRQGDKVLVGAPAATTLAHAQGLLDAGDLAGSVAALGALDGPAAAAMAGWRDQAKSLLDARAALAAMAQR